MAYQVSAETLAQATKCPREFGCLESECCLCRAERHVGDFGVFVRRERVISCPYSMSFGYEYICTCPVCREIYKRYGG